MINDPFHLVRHVASHSAKRTSKYWLQRASIHLPHLASSNTLRRSFLGLQRRPIMTYELDLHGPSSTHCSSICEEPTKGRPRNEFVRHPNRGQTRPIQRPVRVSSREPWARD